MYVNNMATMLLWLTTTLISVVLSRDSNYPGRNQNKRKLSEDYWAEFWKCLEVDYQNLAPSYTKLIEMIYMYPGTSITLACTPCRAPYEDTSMLEWRYDIVGQFTGTQLLDLPQEMTILEGNELRISNARPEWSGWYTCYRGKSMQKIYFVDIPLNATVIQVTGDEIDMKNSITLTHLGVKQTIVWNDWSNCSACGEIGRRFRYGTCMLYLDENQQVDQDTERTNITEFFTKFTNGIACSTSILPEELKLQLRATNFVLEEDCQVRCSESNDTTTYKFQLKNNNVMTTDQMITILEKQMKQFPQVTREIIDIPLYANATIQCKGKMLSNSPITWSTEGLELVPELLQNETGGRITIDFFSRLIFQNFIQDDSRIYSCWEQKRLIGTIHLSATTDEKNYEIQIMIVTTILIVTLLIYIGRNAIRRGQTSQ